MSASWISEWVRGISETSENGQHMVAFWLAFIASMGTFLGGLIVILVTTFYSDPKSLDTKLLMGILQAFSAGVMLYITSFDLIPESIQILGNRETMYDLNLFIQRLYFFAGVVAFWILEYFIPEEHDVVVNGADEHQSQVLTPQPSPRSSKSSPKSKPKTFVEKQKLKRTSLITFLAMGLHNLPEGLGVYLSALSDTKLGLQLAIGIMLHNIPEGMAVAIPLYGATNSYTSVLFWTFMNGLAEPAGVIIGGSILYPYLSHELLSKCLAMVGGMMMCVSIHELIPMAIQYAGKVRSSISFFSGMFLCFAALEAVAEWLQDHEH